MKRALIIFVILLAAVQQICAQQLQPYPKTNMPNVVTDNSYHSKYFFALPRGATPSFPASIPDSLKDGAMWFDTSTHLLKTYDLASLTWNPVSDPIFVGPNFLGGTSSGDPLRINTSNSANASNNFFITQTIAGAFVQLTTINYVGADQTVHDGVKWQHTQRNIFLGEIDAPNLPTGIVDTSAGILRVGVNNQVYKDATPIAVLQQTYANQSTHTVTIFNYADIAKTILRSKRDVLPGQIANSAMYSPSNASELHNTTGSGFFVDIYTSTDNGSTFNLFLSNFNFGTSSTLGGPVGASFLITDHSVSPVLPLVFSSVVGIATTNFVIRETPSGTVDGSNVTFTLANTPTSGTEQIFKNGQLQNVTIDYTISGSTITFINAPITGDRIRANYLK